MPDYDWREFAALPFEERFPGWTSGTESWHWLLQNARREEPFRLLERFRAEVAKYGEPECPRIFVSHRQSDTLCAVRIAELAVSAGFEFWLDVLDPDLQRTPIQDAVVIAGIIEMAIINCTHVIAVMTPETRGSLWVPYEYGRIVDIPTCRSRAGAWLHPDLQLSDYPEYMVQGVTTSREGEITTWLKDEVRSWNHLHGSPCLAASRPWNRAPTTPLPQ